MRSWASRGSWAKNWARMTSGSWSSWSIGADESRENVKRPFIHIIIEPFGSGDFSISFDHLLMTTRIPRRPSNICSLPTRARELHSPGF